MTRASRRSVSVSYHGVMVALACCLVSSGCSKTPVGDAVRSADEAPAVESATPAVPDAPGAPINELLGRLRFVFLEQEVVFAYFVRGREAFLLRPTQETVFTGVNPLAPGDGIGYAGRLMHSASTYRLRGSASDDATEQLRLVSLTTRRFTLESVELVEAGSGPCTVYFGMVLPPRSGSGGFVPVLPEPVRNKTGTFVQDGTGTCQVVMADTGSGQQPTNSFASNGAVDLNRQASWAMGDTN